MAKSSSNDLYRDTFKLGTGTALGQGLLILSAPILSRIFSSETFGTYALFNSFILVLSSISGLRYEQAILLPKLKRNGDNLLYLNLLIGTLFSLIFGLIVYFIRFPLANVFKDESFASYLWLVGFGIFLFSIYNGFNFWNTRNIKYKAIAIGRIAYSIVLVIIQVVSGLLGFTTAFSLIFGVLFGKIAEDLVLVRSALGSLKPVRFFKKRSIVLLKKYRKFPQYNTWATLINTLSWQVPTFLLYIYFDKSSVGFYMMGDRVIRLPMNVIGKAISQVFFQKGTVAHHQNSLDTVFRQSLRMLSNIALIPTIILTFAGKEIFTLFLGSNWSEAGVYAQILSPWAFILFLSSPLSSIINIVEKQEKNLLFNSLILLSRIVSIAIGGYFKNIYLALALFSISVILTYGWLLLWTGTASGVKMRHSFSDIFYSNRFWLAATIIMFTALKIQSPGDWHVVIFSGLFLTAYFVSFRRKIIGLLS